MMNRSVARQLPPPNYTPGRLMLGERKYWFPSKRYDWGWDLPSTWQCMLVLIAYSVLLAVGVHWLLLTHREGGFLLYAGALTVVLVFVCWLKGEPPG